MRLNTGNKVGLFQVYNDLRFIHSWTEVPLCQVEKVSKIHPQDILYDPKVITVPKIEIGKSGRSI